MRHRKVLNLYDTDINHEDLLVYLESIEGSTRQSQALVQMALIGFRVVALHESGDQAYYSVRNPDAAAVLGKKRLQNREVKKAIPIVKPDLNNRVERNQAKEEQSQDALSLKESIPIAEVHADKDAFASENNNHHQDEYNTLVLLKAMSEGQ